MGLSSMARDVRDKETPDADAAASGPADPTDYAAVVRAALANDPMTPEERRAHMAESLERLRELHKWLLEEMGGPLPAGWGARMIREGRL